MTAEEAPLNEPTALSVGLPARHPPLAVWMFGSLQVRLGGLRIPRLRTRKGEWLLALLCLHAGRRLDRSWLAATLWPDSAESQSLGSLRRCLTDLRQALGVEASRLQAPTPRTLLLDLDEAWVDVRAFDAAVASADPARLEEAVGLHLAPLLRECAEEWVFPERDRRSLAFIQALEALAGQAAQDARWDRAEHLFRRALSADPIRESACRGLMRTLAASGQHAEAVQAFRDLRIRLEKEFASEPGAETVAVYERLRTEPLRLAVPRSAPSATSGSGDDAPANVAAPRGAPAGRESRPRHASQPAVGYLPRALSRLVGREEALAAIQGAVRSNRLVTLAGPGGIGKTRLALAAAEGIAPDLGHGAWFVDLAPLTDGELAAQAVATRLSVAEEAGRPILETLAETLIPRSLLLVLDNCEQVVGAVSALAERLLGDCPGVRILATSREPLGVPGEHVWRVPPLPAPPVETGSAAMGEYPAVALFRDRARAVVPEFEITPDNAAQVLRICQALDGIPLGIELAAARLRVLSPAEIAERLDDRFHLLTSTDRHAHPRRRTLWATVDWSYQLLDPEERTLLRKLSVFSGPFTLEDAAAVARLPNERALDAVTQLVDKSLVGADVQRSPAIYRLLETTREFARQLLDDAGEYEAVRGAHVEHFAAVAERARPLLQGREQRKWLDRLQLAQDDLRAALDWLTADRTNFQRLAAAQRFAAAVEPFWSARGHLAEGRQRLEQALAGTLGRSRPRALALGAAASLAQRQGEAERVRDFAEEALRCFEACGEPLGMIAALNHLGSAAGLTGDYSLADEHHTAALALACEHGDRAGEADAHTGLGWAAYARMMLDEARHRYSLSLAIHRELGDPIGIASCLNSLGLTELVSNRYEAALPYLEESIALSREMDDIRTVGIALGNLGIVYASMLRFPEAAAAYRESVMLLHRSGGKRGMAVFLGGCAEVTMRLAKGPADYRLCALLYGASDTLRERIGVPVPASFRQEYQALQAKARETMGADSFDAAFSEGAALSLDDAAALADRVGR